MTCRRALLLVIAVAMLAPSVAKADVTVAEGTPARGFVHLVAAATDPDTGFQIVETTSGSDVPVATAATPDGIETRVPWTCQRNRTFAAVAGDERSAPITVTTPSCASRLKISITDDVNLGGNIRVHILDRWRRGEIAADVCAIRPDTTRACDHLVIPPAQFIADALYDATAAGEWEVEVSNLTQTRFQKVIVAHKHYPGGKFKLLATGDSMMLAPTPPLRRKLSKQARTIRDIYVGSGISRPFVVDWDKLPARQVRAYQPDATVISLGMGDGRDLTDADGTVATCCGDDYVAAYAERVRTIMKTYSRGGKGAVVWLNDPYSLDPRRWPEETAVNAAVTLGAHGLTRVAVVDLAAIFTPDGTYHRTLDGVKVRAQDGIHLSAAGGVIAAHKAIAALRKLGVV